jgi:phosphate/sulfate permease
MLNPLISVRRYGLPTSSSQCITGAIVGVAVLEGAKGVNWRIFGKQFISWVLTLVAVGGCVALIFAQVGLPLTSFTITKLVRK